MAVFATMKLAGRRPWDAAMVALAPGLLLAGTINWDLYAVALLSLGMLAWARRRPVAAGALIGLATAAKFYPFFVLGPLFLLCWRAGKLREFWKALAAAVVAWLVVNVPVMLIDFQGWAKFYTLSRERLEGFSSVWFVLDQAGHGVPDKLLNPLAGGLFALACVGIGLLALTAERRPRLPQLVFLTVAAFLLTNKVYSPQYVLWLIPLAALARPRWRDFLIWQATEVVHFFGIWMLLAGYPPGTPNRGAGQGGLRRHGRRAHRGHAVAVLDDRARHPQPAARPGPGGRSAGRPGRRGSRRRARRVRHAVVGALRRRGPRRGGWW